MCLLVRAYVIRRGVLHGDRIVQSGERPRTASGSTAAHINPDAYGLHDISRAVCKP